MNLQMAPYVSKAALVKDFPQIENAVYSLGTAPVLLRDGEATATENVHLVDGNLFAILKFPFILGDRESALDQVGSVVLADSEARKLFGSANPLGQTLTLVSRGTQTDYRLTGVLADPPKNQHFESTIVARFDPATYFTPTPDLLPTCACQSGGAYV